VLDVSMRDERLADFREEGIHIHCWEISTPELALSSIEGEQEQQHGSKDDLSCRFW
jgi:hypothetical protein